VIRLLKRRMHEYQPPGAPTAAQEDVLGLLLDGGETTPGDLAAAERMRPQSMGEMLSDLERLGLVARSPHPSDRRRVLISLTGAGRVGITAGRNSRQDRLVAAISELFDGDERARLIDGIQLLLRLAEA
jgi:DNA-binding MarR family transcriptional regulator